jgi:hypothetical protein
MFWSVVTFSLLSAEFFWLSVLPDVQTAAMAVSRDARVAEVVKAAAAGHHRVRHHLLAHIAVELRQDPIVVVWDVRHRGRGQKTGPALGGARWATALGPQKLWGPTPSINVQVICRI